LMIETNGVTVADKRREAYRIANDLYERNPDWVTFYREVLGVGGVARKLFTSNDEMADFEQSKEFNEIQQMVARLRVQGGEANPDKEPTRVITVRLPKSLHESLKGEATARNTSMN